MGKPRPLNPWEEHEFKHMEMLRFASKSEMISANKGINKAKKRKKIKFDCRMDDELNMIIVMFNGLHLRVPKETREETLKEYGEIFAKELLENGTAIMPFSTASYSHDVAEHVNEVLRKTGKKHYYRVAIKGNAKSSLMVVGKKLTKEDLVEDFESVYAHLNTYGKTIIKNETVDGYGKKACENILTKMCGSKVKIDTKVGDDGELWHFPKIKELYNV